jgi:hypothetical protein
LFGCLLRFDHEYVGTWGNIALALRRFSFSYDRFPPRAEDRIVDAFIAIEALLSRDSAELTFKLAFRAAGILATDDDERTALFEQIKDYYDTRSKIVHGAKLKVKQLNHIREPEPLLDITRRLLVAFLHLAESHQHGPEQFYRDIDGVLQHNRRRSMLRKCMGLA